MWKDGAGNKIESVKDWLKTNLATGDFGHISVGCDAAKTRRNITFVSSIVLDKTDNRGSIFIWNREIKPVHFLTVPQKLMEEAERTVKLFSDVDIVSIAKAYHVTCAAHIDISLNPKYKSNEMLKAIRGWIEGIGVKVIAKPDSYAANAVADRFARTRCKLLKQGKRHND